MKEQLKKWIAVLFLVIPASFMTACTNQFLVEDMVQEEESEQNPEEGLIVVGVSQVGSESIWRTAHTASIQETLTTENGYYLIFDNARQKQENQIKAIRNFISQDVDYIVLETGLGGRLDATNVIEENLCSVITQIDLDHTERLGNTKELIAKEKAGIIKENSDTVIFHQEPEVDNVFIEQCKKKNNKLHIVKEDDIKDYKYDENYQYFTYKDVKNIELVLKGKAQIKNASICIETMKILNEKGFKVDEKNIKEGMKTVVHKARMEVLNKKPLIVYDGAHNAPAIKNLQEMVQMYFKDLKRTYIISILKTKDYDKMLQLLAEDKEAKFILTSGNDAERYVSKEDLANTANKYIDAEHIIKMNLKDAVKEAMRSNEEMVTLIVGSFYVYGTVVETLKN